MQKGKKRLTSENRTLWIEIKKSSLEKVSFLWLARIWALCHLKIRRAVMCFEYILKSSKNELFKKHQSWLMIAVKLSPADSGKPRSKKPPQCSLLLMPATLCPPIVIPKFNRLTHWKCQRDRQVWKIKVTTEEMWSHAAQCVRLICGRDGSGSDSLCIWTRGRTGWN